MSDREAKYSPPKGMCVTLKGEDMRNNQANNSNSFAEQKLHSMLLELGYPQESIELADGYTGSYMPDLIVYRPGIRHEPLAIFEVKSDRYEYKYTRDRVAEVGAKMRSLGWGCHAYLVIVANDDFRYFDCTIGSEERLLQQIPTYDVLENEARSRAVYIEYLRLENFTLFRDSNFEFGKSINLIIAENGFGKSTLLKVLFSEARYASDFSWNARPGAIVKEPYIERFLGVKGSALVTHGSKGRTQVEVGYGGSLKNKSVLAIEKDLVKYQDFPSFKNKIPTVVFVQSHELITNYQFYSSISNIFEDNMSRDGTILDTIHLLGLPRLKVIPKEYVKLSRIIEKEIGGSIEFDKKEGRFFCKVKGWKKDRLSIDMTAEGWRKLGQLLVLIRNGALTPGSILFWDEPEANLNPKLIKVLVRLLVELSKLGVQCFMSTHSLFLANEVELQTANEAIAKDVRYINLKAEGKSQCSTSLSELLGVSLMDESMAQSDRYMGLDL